jgi:hypothetical protein
MHIALGRAKMTGHLASGQGDVLQEIVAMGLERFMNDKSRGLFNPITEYQGKQQGIYLSSSSIRHNASTTTI